MHACKNINKMTEMQLITKICSVAKVNIKQHAA